MQFTKSLVIGLGLVSLMACEKSKLTKDGWTASTITSEVNACASDLYVGFTNLGESTDGANDVCECYVNAASQIHTLSVFQNPSNQEWQEERGLLNACLGQAGKNLRFLVALSVRTVAQEPVKKDETKAEAPATHSEANTKPGTQRQRFQGRLREVIQEHKAKAEPADPVPPAVPLPVTVVKSAKEMVDNITIPDLVTALDMDSIREIRLSQGTETLGEKIYGNPGRDKYWDMFFDQVRLRIVFKDGTIADVDLRCSPKQAHDLYKLTTLVKRPSEIRSGVRTRYAPVAIVKDLKPWAEIFANRDVKSGAPGKEHRKFAETDVSREKDGPFFQVERDKVVETRMGGHLKTNEKLPAE